MILWVMTVNQMLKRTRLGHTPLGLTGPGPMCQAVLPRKEEQAPRRSAAVLGVSREETASLKDSKWRYRGTAQEEGLGGRKTLGSLAVVGTKACFSWLAGSLQSGMASKQLAFKHAQSTLCQGND